MHAYMMHIAKEAIMVDDDEPDFGKARPYYEVREARLPLHPPAGASTTWLPFASTRPIDVPEDEIEPLGITIPELEAFVHDGIFSPAELDRLAISRKTLSHRRLFGRLTEDQSDRVLRIVRMVREARDVFGDNHKADTWLRRPTRPLGGIAPLELLSTDAGTKRVEALLGRIDHGIAA